MRTLYSERQAALVQALRAEADGLVEVEPSPAGLHLVAWLPEGLDDKQVAREAATRGIQTRPLSGFYSDRPTRGGLELGYAAFNAAKLRRGAARLTEAIRACMGNAQARRRRVVAY